MSLAVVHSWEGLLVELEWDWWRWSCMDGMSVCKNHVAGNFMRYEI